MSTNKIDEMTESEAKDILNEVCAAFKIGGAVRTKSTIMANISNSIRRGQCLTLVETLYTEIEHDENDEEVEVSLLRWGEEPSEYLERFRKVACV